MTSAKKPAMRKAPRAATRCGTTRGSVVVVDDVALEPDSKVIGRAAVREAIPVQRRKGEIAPVSAGS
jgi:hypothetical protein